MKTTYRARINSTTSAPVGSNQNESSGVSIRDNYKLIHTNSSSSMWLSNSLNAAIGQIVEAIISHSRLPPSHDLAVDPKVSEQAIELLGRLIYNYPIKNPTFFPQEGENVVFKWEGDRVGRYLSITNDGVSLMDLEPISQMYCEYDLSKGENLDFETLVRELTNASLSTTSISVQDA